jgi:hypothetical protein
MISEGQACGCIVAGYGSGAIPEVGGDAAALVDEGDVKALAAAVLRLLEDSGEYSDRRQAGLRRSLARTWDAVAREQVRFYERALERQAGPLQVGPPASLRAEAAAEFGAPAETAGQVRTFALPLLRKPSPLSDHLGRLIDLGGRIRAGVSGHDR